MIVVFLDLLVARDGNPVKGRGRPGHRRAPWRPCSQTPLATTRESMEQRLLPARRKRCTAGALDSCSEWVRGEIRLVGEGHVRGELGNV